MLWNYSHQSQVPTYHERQQRIEPWWFRLLHIASGHCVYKWMDNTAVNVISNLRGTERDKISRTQKDGSKKRFSCPKAINDYNQYIGGVGKADFYCAIYGINRKSKKWQHRLFSGLIEKAWVNTYVTYRKVTASRIPSLELLLDVMLLSLWLYWDAHQK